MIFMNKTEVAELIARDLGCSRASALKTIDTVLQGLESAISQSDSVTLSGFGRFSRKERVGRIVRNPATGEPMTVEPSISVGFRPGSRLKKVVQGDDSPRTHGR